VFLIHVCHSQDFKGFDDTILYKINWPGKDVTDRFVKVNRKCKLNLKIIKKKLFELGMMF